MYQKELHQQLTKILSHYKIGKNDNDTNFIQRFSANVFVIQQLYLALYSNHTDSDIYFEQLVQIIAKSYIERSDKFKNLDSEKEKGSTWYLSNDIVGMSLYVDRFCGSLKKMTEKLDYFTELGVNFLHLMPIMQSPVNASDGGYAVSNFRAVDPRFGSNHDLVNLIDTMKDKGIYLMLDIVLNHTSTEHEWALKASAGDTKYQDYFYMYDDRTIPDIMEKSMPDIFPDSSPGSFTNDPSSKKWVMSVFNHYQWDLNYTNPAVFVDMLDTIFFYANLGVDILRIDAPAFIWKQVGTSCQNLPQAHTLLQLIKHCVQVASPGMALLGEAIVAPKEIMKYFGTGVFQGRECDVAYNATHMALQWDALATGNTQIMMSAQHDILQKPKGTTWVNYTRCHDDIGLGYEDGMIRAAGFEPHTHRHFIKNYYSGNYRGSTAKGALFGVNPKTDDARISGSLASLCGLEYGIEHQLIHVIQQSIDKILLMQCHSILLGGIPTLFYGDECGYTNDYSYLADASKNYDNRWMHRPIIDWKKNAKRSKSNTPEHAIFNGTQRIIAIRKQYQLFGDMSNIYWMPQQNVHIAGYVRYNDDEKMICLFNFSAEGAFLSYYALRHEGYDVGTVLQDLWRGTSITVGRDDEYIVLKPYQFMILKFK